METRYEDGKASKWKAPESMDHFLQHHYPKTRTLNEKTINFCVNLLNLKDLPVAAAIITQIQ